MNYQRRPDDYLRAKRSVIGRKKAACRFDQLSDQAAERDWEDEGGSIKPVTRLVGLVR